MSKNETEIICIGILVIGVVLSLFVIGNCTAKEKCIQKSKTPEKCLQETE